MIDQSIHMTVEPEDRSYRKAREGVLNGKIQTFYALLSALPLHQLARDLELAPEEIEEISRDILRLNIYHFGLLSKVTGISTSILEPMLLDAGQEAVDKISPEQRAIVNQEFVFTFAANGGNLEEFSEMIKARL